MFRNSLLYRCNPSLGKRYAHSTIFRGISNIEITPPADRKIWQPLINAIANYRMHHQNVSVVHKCPESTETFSIALSKSVPSDNVVPHLATHCYNLSAAKALLRRYQEAGIKRLFVVRGDNKYVQKKVSSPNHNVFIAPIGSQHELTVLEAICLARDMGFFLSAACHPEGHPNEPSINAQINHALEKQKAGCLSLVTQSIFHLPPIVAFEQKAREAGLSIPMTINIIPIFSTKILQKFVEENHLSLPPELLNLDNNAKLDYYVQLITDLINSKFNIAFSTLSKVELLDRLVSREQMITGGAPPIFNPFQGETI